ncbi:MAG: Uracil-DNA glycosylase [Thermodesulfobacteriota bacterium]|nr:Uracil-DNA glycosylase [Thermodesulfobacteriota bacterium]
MINHFFKLLHKHEVKQVFNPWFEVDKENDIDKDCNRLGRKSNLNDGFIHEGGLSFLFLNIHVNNVGKSLRESFFQVKKKGSFVLNAKARM